MQFRPISGFFIFVGSYLPLAIILAVQDIPAAWWGRPTCGFRNWLIFDCAFIPFTHPILSITFLLLAFFAMLLVYFLFRKIQYPFNVQIISAKSIPNEIINYVFPYVVSFMGISYDQPEKLLGFGVFLLWMFAITYKSGQIMMNPLLLMFGWNLYEAKIKINSIEKDVRILKRGRLDVGSQMSQKIQEFYISRD